MEFLPVLAKHQEGMTIESVELGKCVKNAEQKEIIAYDDKGIDLSKCGVNVVGHPDAIVWYPYFEEAQQWFTLLKEEQCRAIRILITHMPNDLQQQDADHVLDTGGENNPAAEILKILKGI